MFAGKLSNPELHPNKDAIQRRDVVATNMAKDGFWRRIYDDYSTRQVIFEVKNYITLKTQDFRQALSYSGGSYGRFIIIVTRSENEGITDVDKGWISEMYHTQNCLRFIVPAIILSRCISKLKKAIRYDYTEHSLNKRLDTFCRSYLALKHIKKYGSSGKSVGKFRFGKFPHRQK